jgi:hypothetical protein
VLIWCSLNLLRGLTKLFGTEVGKGALSVRPFVRTSVQLHVLINMDSAIHNFHDLCLSDYIKPGEIFFFRLKLEI